MIILNVLSYNGANDGAGKLVDASSTGAKLADNAIDDSRIVVNAQTIV